MVRRLHLHRSPSLHRRPQLQALGSSAPSPKLLNPLSRTRRATASSAALALHNPLRKAHRPTPQVRQPQRRQHNHQATSLPGPLLPLRRRHRPHPRYSGSPLLARKNRRHQRPVFSAEARNLVRSRRRCLALLPHKAAPVPLLVRKRRPQTHLALVDRPVSLGAEPAALVVPSNLGPRLLSPLHHSLNPLLHLQATCSVPNRHLLQETFSAVEQLQLQPLSPRAAAQQPPPAQPRLPHPPSL